ncbi:MAG: hypothetical protein U0Q19_14670 [Kineosporiaceae bacterium]
MVQTGQRLAHRVLGRVLDAEVAAGEPDLTSLGRRMPRPLRWVTKTSVPQRVPAIGLAIGPLPEHAPSWACR